MFNGVRLQNYKTSANIQCVNDLECNIYPGRNANPCLLSCDAFLKRDDALY